MSTVEPTLQPTLAPGVQLTCTACELAWTSPRLNCLGGDGPLELGGILFVGQAPGAAEEVYKYALAGETGFLFADLLKEIGLTRQQVRVTNAIRCKPPAGKDPQTKHIQACRPWLIDEIKLCRPRVIVVLGAVALQSVLGKNAITQVRGRFFETDLNGQLDYKVIVYCMLMPAVLFRRWEEYPVILADFQKLGRMLVSGFEEGSLGDYQILTTVDSVREYFEYLKSCPRVSFDLETGGFDFTKDPILCLSVSGYPHTGAVVPFVQQHFKPVWRRDDWNQVYDILDDFFAGDTPKWAQNGVFDINFIRQAGFRFNLKSFTLDTMLAHHTVQENTGHDLNTLISQLTNMPLYDSKLTEWVETCNNGKRVKTYAEYPNDVLWTYAAADADATTQAGDILLHQMQNEWTESIIDGIPKPFPLIDFFNNIVMPLNRALINMERRGIRFDMNLVKKIHQEVKTEESELTLKIHRLIGRQFNLGSGVQLGVALFSDPPLGLGLPIVRMTPGGRPATDEESMNELGRKTQSLPDGDPRKEVVSLILGVKKKQKLISTYLEGKDGESGMLKHVRADGRVHPRFVQHTVVTGRLATREPAIHNIPKPLEGEKGGDVIRHLFTVPQIGDNHSVVGLIDEEWWWIGADYSQLELRVIAGMAGEETMMKAFAEGKDGHQVTASEIFGKAYEDVTYDERQVGKGVNFGIVYGQGPYSLAQQFGWEVWQAEDYIKKYFIRFPKLKEYFERVRTMIREKGYCINPLGRKRRLYGYQFLDEKRMQRYSGGNYAFVQQCKFKREEMERQGINSGIQGGGSDRMARATAEIDQAYTERGMKSGLILSHHDMLGAEAPTSELFEAAYILVERMEAPVPEMYGLTFPVDMEIGRRWDSCDYAMTDTVREYIKQRRVA